MKPIKTRVLKGALESKGFIQNQSHHTFYTLYVNNIKTSVRTKISHGDIEYSEHLLKRMYKQLKLNKNEFLKLIECPLSKQAYISLLIERKMIKI